MLWGKGEESRILTQGSKWTFSLNCYWLHSALRLSDLQVLLL